jgi:glc operon protein GlcG
MITLQTLATACATILVAALPALAQPTPATPPSGASPTPPAPLPTYGPPITLEVAKKVMAGAEAEAAKNNWNVVITILDSGGNMVMMHKFDDTQLVSISIAEGKARTALMFKQPSKNLEEAIAAGGRGLRFTPLGQITPIEGGHPIIVDGKIIGAIGVSGVLSAHNTQIARAGIEALK